MQQRVEDPLRVYHAGVAQPVDRLVDEGDQVVRAMGEGGVVERAVLLGDPLHGAAQLVDQRARERPDVGRGGHAERDALAQPDQVLGAPGERHRRVHRQRLGTARDRRGQYPDAVRPRRVRHGLPLAHGQLDDQRWEHVIGNSEEGDVGFRGRGAAGADLISGVGQGGGQHRADAAGAKDAEGAAAQQCAHCDDPVLEGGVPVGSKYGSRSAPPHRTCGNLH
ncbi:MAG: hypothetical protein AUG44_08925 [Actinobacteria bacterium 13_1_20CM_3_71_11]|nr:MAG: hypothetical protein AUG44_08925 [Actinobacteria bacterium 13_1_20CM_3_71_11]